MTKRIAGSDLETRFWLNVRSSRDGCWEWTGASNRAGYGRVYTEGKSVQAHRYSWLLHSGEIPEGLLVCHHCDNPPCIRPSHLFLGTVKDNAHDALKKGRLDLHNWRMAVRHGSKHSLAKLTEQEVRDIRALRSSGLLMRVIADKFGVSLTTISDVISGKLWGHVG